MCIFVRTVPGCAVHYLPLSGVEDLALASDACISTITHEASKRRPVHWYVRASEDAKSTGASCNPPP